MQIKLDKQGYVEEFMLSGGVGILPDSLEIDDLEIDLEDFKKNYQAYKFQENKLICDADKLSSVFDENLNIELRNQRERECFKFINRGWLWYSTLSSSQMTELTSWYKAWLDVTKTKKVPSKPTWLD